MVMQIEIGAGPALPGESDEVCKSRRTRTVCAKKHMGRPRSPYEERSQKLQFFKLGLVKFSKALRHSFCICT